MSEQYLSLDQQIANIEANIRLIEERKSEYAEITAIPLDLIRDERSQRARLQELLTQQKFLRSVDCPYRGLEVFKEEHALYFHGRSAMVAQLGNKLRLTTFVVVIGVSGSGKSSLVRAGLIPALRSGALPGSSAWQIAVFRPGADPLTSLCAVLVNFLSPGLTDSAAMMETRHLADDLLMGRLVMSRDILPRLAQQSTNPQFLIVIDQFEEIFDPQVDMRIREQFVQSITDTGAAEWLRIVVTLRANYFDEALQQPRLREKLAAGQFTVLPMNEAERRDAIMLPSINTGRSFEPGLVDRILEDLSAAAGELPLLEFAMTQLWQRQAPAGVLTHAAYEEIGAVGGAIARHASEIFASVPLEQQQQIQQLCTRLVRIDADEEQAERLVAEATIRRVSLDDLAPATQVLIHDVLAAQRLVIVGRNESTNSETVELVHEALIRSWPQLSQWLVDDAPNLRTQQSLAEAVQIWERFDRSPELLYSGRRLRAIVDWNQTRQGTLTTRETEFLRLSIAARTRQRWLMAAGALTLLVVIGGLIATIVIRSSPTPPTAMPPNHFNIAVADFVVEAPAETAAEVQDDLQRDANSLATQMADSLVAAKAVLQTDVFSDDISIWGPSQFSIDVTNPISVQQTMHEKNINLLLYGQIAPGKARYWQIQPYFVVEDAVFSDRVGEMLGTDQLDLGAPISYILANQQSIKDVEQELQDRFETLGQLIRGLTQYDLGTEAGYRQAREILCADTLHLAPDEQQEGAGMLLLFCGHASNMLASNRDNLKYGFLVSESERAYRAGLDVSPNNLRLQAALASILVSQIRQIRQSGQSRQSIDCTKVEDSNKLNEASKWIESFMTSHNQGASVPLTTLMEANGVSGIVHFWQGYCSSSDVTERDRHWEHAESAYRTAVGLLKNAKPNARYALRVAGEAEYYRGELGYMRYTTQKQGASAPDQYRVDSTDAFSSSISYYLAIGDAEAINYAATAAAFSIWFNCENDHPEVAAAMLAYLDTQVSNPELFREQVFSELPPGDIKKGCGL